MVSLSKTSNRKISRTYIFCRCQYVGEGCQKSRDAKIKALLVCKWLFVVTNIFFSISMFNDKNQCFYFTKKENKDVKSLFDKVAEAPI